MSYLTQSIHRLLQRSPHALASVDGADRRTWTKLAQDVGRFAAALQASDVQQGDRIALLAHNSGLYLDYLFGTFWAGAVINPVNTRWAPREIAASLEDCGTTLLLVDRNFAPLIDAIRAAAPGLTKIVQFGGGDRDDGVEDGATWLENGEPVEDVRRGGQDLAAILYTGGTTGRSKGVMLSHANLLASATGYLSFPGARPGRSYLHVAPLFHIGAQSAIYTSMMAGATQVFLTQFEPKPVLDVIEQETITDIFLVPTMLRAILTDPTFDPLRAASLERIVYGASPIDDALLERAMDALPQTGFVQAYGMTEVSPIATILGPDDHSLASREAGRRGSAGRPTTAAEIRIVDRDDQQLSPGGIGEILVRGGGVMLGYWGMPEATKDALRGGWMHTGDLGRIDPEGYLTVVDRLKDMIISGGENVYSAEVENALASHPAVHQVAVIGLSDSRWGERVHGVVVLRPGMICNQDELRQHCRALIAGYKVPKSVSFVAELPLSPAGKILKTVLREGLEVEMAPAESGSIR